MLGFATFHLLVLVFVGANALADRGVRDRICTKTAYSTLLKTIIDFERAGGRIEDFQSRARTARQLTWKLILQMWFFTLAVVLGLAMLGLPLWIPSTVIGLCIIFAGLTGWVISDPSGLVDASQPRSRMGAIGALIAILLKSVVATIGILQAASGVFLINTGDWVKGLVYLIVAIILITYCYLPVAYVDRRMQKLKEVDFAQTSKTDSFLFLRSFGDDNIRLYSPYGSLGPRWRFIPGRRRLEELVASSLIETTDLVGIERPGKAIASLGASRIHWNQESWKEAIKSTATRTEGVIVVAGRTPGLNWEVTQLSELGLLGKTIILFPPGKGLATVERYDYIRRAIGFPPELTLPNRAKNLLVAIAFEPQGVPVHYISDGRDWAAYVAAVLHFRTTLGKKTQSNTDPEHASLEDDPFLQAAFLLEEGNRELAEAILDEVTIGPSDTSGKIGRVWERVAMREDLAGARNLLLSLPSQDQEPMIQRALEALEALEDGRGDARQILRARYRESCSGLDDRAPIDTVRLDRISAIRFVFLLRRIVSAEEDSDLESARETSTDLLRVAQSTGIATVIAEAKVQLGTAEFQLRNFDRASELFGEAAGLRDAPQVRVSGFGPRLKPAQVVDEALSWLVRVADEGGIVSERISALRELLEFRTRFGSSEDAALTAEELGRLYGENDDLAAARSLFVLALSAYSRVGRAADAGWVKYWLAKVESQRGNPRGALTLLRESAEVSARAGNYSRQSRADGLAGNILEELGKNQKQQDLLLLARDRYRSGVEAARMAVVETERQEVSDAEELRRVQLDLSAALNDLGFITQREDPESADHYFLESAEIRGALVVDDPQDHLVARGLAYSMLYLAVNSTKCQSNQSPSRWAEALSRFAVLAESPGGNLVTAGNDFKIAIEEFSKAQSESRLSSDQLLALTLKLPTILGALGRIIEMAPPDVAYKTTEVLFRLATTFEADSKTAAARDIHDAVLTARRQLCVLDPNNRLFRRGLGYSLLSADTRFLPEEPELAICDLREAILTFSELVEMSVEAGTGAKGDLLFGRIHAAGRLHHYRTTISPELVREFAEGAVEVGRQLMLAEPQVARWTRNVAWALSWIADSFLGRDDSSALRYFQAILDLQFADGVPPTIRWTALRRSGDILDQAHQSGAINLYNLAADLAKAQSLSHPEDDDWAARLCLSLALAAEAESSTHPEAALAKWRECIDLLSSAGQSSRETTNAWAEVARDIEVLSSHTALLAKEEETSDCTLRRSSELR